MIAWEISIKEYIDHVTSPGFHRVRKGIYLDLNKANEAFEKLAKQAISDPLYYKEPDMNRIEVIE